MYSDHKLIRFEIEFEETKATKHRKMNADQKASYTRQTRAIAHDLEEQSYANMVDVDKVEHLATQLVSKLTDAYNANSTEYEVKSRPEPNFWFVPEIKEAQQKNRALKHIYDDSGNNPKKRQEWKKQEAHLTHLCKKHRSAERKGNLDKIVSQGDMAKLTKFAKNGTNREIALIKNADNKSARSPEEALQNMCDAHFEGSTVLNTDEVLRSINRSKARIGETEVVEHPWNSLEHVRKVINTFTSGKAPGLDGITPDQLKLFSDEILPIIQRLFDMMLSLNYTPSILRTSKVIFIPKQGKDDYTLAKAYRPISLTPFLFKLQERLSAWNILETALRKNPLHKRQHAYRMGRSTESAISQVLNEIERGKEKGLKTLTTFIDISSAWFPIFPPQIFR